MKPNARRVGVGLLAVVMIGCPEDNTSKEGPGGEVDTTEVDGADAVVNDLGVEGDTTDVEAPDRGPDVDLGDFGAPCQSNTECESGWCVRSETGNVCTRTCIDQCPDGWGCVGVTNTGGDVTFICMPRDYHLCQPCASASQCGQGLCVELEDGLACTRPCSDKDPCPDGYSCQVLTPEASPDAATSQCVPVSGGCDCTAQHKDQVQACSIANDIGTCWGIRTCLGTDGWSACSVAAPEAETCDGKDNDCNGVADDAPEPPADQCVVSNEFGACLGTWFCNGASGWQCFGETPAVEICDVVDNDCDGQTDEDFKNAAGAYVSALHCGGCGNDCTGKFQNGSSTCDAVAEPPRCVVDECDPGYFKAGPFACLPVGSSLCLPCAQDANCVVPGDRCLTIGGGTYCGQDCGPGSVHGDTCPTGFNCEPQDGGGSQCVPASGACDCRPGDEGKKRPCTSENAYGTCFGEASCNPETGWSNCGAKEPGPESCNGVDDDCDLIVDENVTPPAPSCEVTNDIGTCAGTPVCGGLDGWVCQGAVATVEVCDHVDNDCDGQTDEEFKNAAGLYAQDAHCGICNFSCDGAVAFATAASCQVLGGVPTCVPSACQPGYFVAPGAPVCVASATALICTPCVEDIHCASIAGGKCEALDGGSFCTTACGADGSCLAGFACQDGRCRPFTSSCSCMPGGAGKVRPCFEANANGTCAGQQVCDPDQDPGWSDCTAAVPQAETCNGVDDNCNGLTDEGVVAQPTACHIQNAFGTCSAPRVCLGTAGWTCPAATPAPEVCDGVDNDCDGLVDEGFRDPATGKYIALEHCGGCGNDCTGVFPNAVATCDASQGTPRCKVGVCDEGYYRSNDFTCLPVVSSLCQPCVVDANCSTPGDTCLTIDGSGRCGQDCAAGSLHGDGGCPESYECKDQGNGAFQCEPTSGSCTCLPDNAGDMRGCLRSSPFGSCTGTQTCAPQGGWSDCSASTPAAETCNGKDDDCNGQVDEGLAPPPQPCAVTNQHGTCTDNWECRGTVGWKCDAATPAAEACNGKDDDCDGSVDEDFKDPPTGLYVDDDHCGLCDFACDGAVLFATETECQLLSGKPTCVALACDEGYFTPPGSPGLCVPIAEGLACSPCSADAHCASLVGGKCETIGGGTYCTRSCEADGSGCSADYDCIGGRCLPRSGSCTCLSPQAGSLRSCFVGNAHGTCAGTQQCNPAVNPGWSTCTAKAPKAELCNGADDDCNGLIDEGVVSAPVTCQVQNAFGTCVAPFVCGGSQGWLCPAKTPAAEACNGQDDDCDGGTDEDFRQAGTGAYHTLAHCGSCGNDCTGRFANATATCDALAAPPRCVVGQCHPGYYKFNETTCLPVVSSLCQPCLTDANCAVPGDRCVSVGGGTYCAQACGAGSPHGTTCPAGFGCEVSGGSLQCIPVSGSCSCIPGDEAEVRSCAQSNAHGTCFGIETCDPALGWNGCTAAIPAAETCNGQDDDCDGIVDESPAPPAAPCQSQNAAGICVGAWSCTGAGGWICNVPDPSVEVCDQADNDCDGSVDEDFRDGQGRYVMVRNCGFCGNDCTGTFPNGSAGCDVSGAVPQCKVAACDAGFYRANDFTCLPIQSSLCQSCITDSNCVMPGDRCLTIDGSGRCGQDCGPGSLHGTTACPAGYECAEIGASVHQCRPISGACDCLPGEAGKKKSCVAANGFGTCFGERVCDPTAGWSACSAPIPAAEACNGADDDCDGLLDEDVTPPSGPCEVVNGAGTCTGVWSCGGPAGWRCSAATPAAESCNNVDDDCDGQTDEDFKDAQGRYVHDAHCGLCGFGCDGAVLFATATQCQVVGSKATCVPLACEEGHFVPPAAPTVCAPIAEGLACSPCSQDSQCASLIGGLCETVENGTFCTRSCTAPADCSGDYECAGGRCLPRTGSCSCLTANAGSIRPCFAGNQHGTCSGVQTCDPAQVPGWSACSASVPAAETCNGVDDDCNGFTDEGVVANPVTCDVTNAFGTCSASRVCSGVAGWTCPAATPAAETCDQKDNDCDGQVDEDFRDAQSGAYTALAHCGACGNDCTGAFHNATAVCNGGYSPPRCTVGACAPGFYRLNDFSCLPVISTLCAPCTSNANCVVPGDRCLPGPGGSRCGRSCAADSVHGAECPDGFDCVDVGGGDLQCRPRSGACDCIPGDAGNTRSCAVANPDGTCFGTETCFPSSGWSTCTAATPVGESCNGLDDDCDSVIDENAPPPAEPCAVTNAFGTCAHTWRCTGQGGWVCDAGTPAAETCDGADNDCDGQVDEDFRDSGSGKYVALQHCGFCGNDCTGRFPNGTAICAATSGVPICVVASCDAGYYQASPFACLPIQSSLCQPCLSDANCVMPGDRCVTLGSGQFCGQNCASGSLHGTTDCPGGFQCLDFGSGIFQCAPVSGACDCLPGDEGLTKGCSRSNVNGTCLGTTTCDPQTGFSPCTAPVPAAETCNGVDDDCDGVADEGVVQPAAACASTNAFGTCTGTWQCGGTAGWVCPAPTPVAEVCDGADNDCDGQTDEDFKDAGTGFYVHDDHCGLCGFSCEDAVLFASSSQCQIVGNKAKCLPLGCIEGYFIPPASPTVCVPIAEGLACSPCASNDQCSSLIGGRCDSIDGGTFCTRSCDVPGDCSGDYECVGGRCVPTSGSCTCLSANEGSIRSCYVSNVNGTCGGLQTCTPTASPGWSSCSAPAPQVESCNGVDDDCDGLTDEGVTHSPAQCTVTNPFGTCSAPYVCGGTGGWLCPAAVPAAELCDHKDNDCDGQTDEDFRDPGTGLYVSDQACGACGVICSGTIANATAHCAVAAGQPRCEVLTCNAGYTQSGPFSCLSQSLGLCAPCLTAENCVIDGAFCDLFEDGGYCVNPCPSGGVCPGGFTCDGTYCRPDTGSCTCDGSNTSLERICQGSYTPPGGTPYTCPGRQDCTVSGWSTCLMPAETCNLLDDDCDGQVDEGFRDGDGRYVADEHCGGCGNNCSLIIFPGGAGSCNTFVDPPVCSVSCSGSCFDVNANPSDGCECCNPVPTDLPDPLGVDANCDGIDGEKGNGIFVTKAGNDANPGTLLLPRRPIQAGIDAAVAQGKRDVYVATGVYVQAIALVAGVGVYGGYSADFRVRNATQYESAILGPAPTAQRPGAVNATGIQGGTVGTTVFAGFSVFGFDVKTPGKSSYGIYVRDCDNTVSIRNNTVFGGSGGKGARGADGGDGGNGAAGTPGLNALDLLTAYGVQEHDCTSANHSPGGHRRTRG